LKFACCCSELFIWVAVLGKLKQNARGQDEGGSEQQQGLDGAEGGELRNDMEVDDGGGNDAVVEAGTPEQQQQQQQSPAPQQQQQQQPHDAQQQEPSWDWRPDQLPRDTLESLLRHWVALRFV
jgi:hypothetical protein